MGYGTNVREALTFLHDQKRIPQSDIPISEFSAGITSQVPWSTLQQLVQVDRVACVSRGAIGFIRINFHPPDRRCGGCVRLKNRYGGCPPFEDAQKA